MRKCYLIIFLLIFCSPTLAFAQYEPSEHRWTIGYEGGPTLRRFLGDDWEVYLGGGPSDFKSDGHSISFRDYDTGELLPNVEEYDYYKTEQGHVFLGVGRTILRDGRFWLAGIVHARYQWSNFQNGSDREYFRTENSYQRSEVGHRMNTEVYLFLRPAFDVTSRITFMVKLGAYYRHWTETTDSWAINRDDEKSTNRYYGSGSSFSFFGYSGIESISFMFRF